MKKTQIVFGKKNKLQNTVEFATNYQESLQRYLNEGYEIKASNMTNDNVYMYLYTLLEKDE